MNDINSTVWNKKLPSLFGVLVLVFALGTIGWLSRNAILFGTKAAVDNTPKDVQISNVTDSSFTVSYVTDANVIGSVDYGTNGQTTQVALDARDQTIGKAHTTHYITVKNLKPSTKYAFVVTSGAQKFSKGNLSYEVTTTIPVASAGAQVQLIGKATTDDGVPAADAIAYVTTPEGQLQSTLVGGNGEYKLALNELNPEAKLKLQLQTSITRSHVDLLANQIDPVPLIILGQNYDFAVSNEPLAPSPIASGSAEISETPPAFPTVDDGGITKPTIINPKDEQTLKDTKPLFRGTAVPNERVTITIHSDEAITATVTADENGTWQYRPDTPLSPGTHTITMRTIDAAGLVKVITQSFVVYAEGSQFVEPSVSPSLSPSVTPSVPPTAKPTSKPSATATPTPKITSPTPTQKVATPSPSATKTPTPTKKITSSVSPTTPPVPVTGNTAMTIMLTGFVLLIGIGTLLFFLTAV